MATASLTHSGSRPRFGRPERTEIRANFARDVLADMKAAYFDDVDEMDLFKQVYAIARRKGSHPGVTDEVWGRLVCHLCWTTGYFLLNRYSVWNSHGRRWPAHSSMSGAGNGGGMPWRWLQGCVAWPTSSWP